MNCEQRLSFPCEGVDIVHIVIIAQHLHIVIRLAVGTGLLANDVM